jgi:hypothetical protein
MSSKQGLVVLNGHNYGVWAQDKETLLKSITLWHFTWIVVLDMKDDQHKFIIDEKKDEHV